MKRRLTDLCLMAMMGTVMVVSKEALAFLPNVELVSLLTILFTLVFRRRVIGALAVFLLLDLLAVGGLLALIAGCPTGARGFSPWPCRCGRGSP